MRRRFFVDSFDENSANLRGDAAEHLGRALRAERGQFYELSDGHQVWLGRVERIAISRRGDSHIEFALVEPIPVCEPSLTIDLLISIIKFDRFEWCLEKATELGVTEIVPLAAARTDKLLLAAAEKRHTRWERILLESSQQSRRLRPPVVRSAARPGDAFAQCAAASKLLLSERREAPKLRSVLNGGLPHSSAKTTAHAPAVALAIGPEGGWTDDEFYEACTCGFNEVSLGGNILRTETAVVASLAILCFALDA
jgi:16S rRNA (uracil1498-N3)-methyltransferase